ncbi:hypothetical protein NIES4106_05830 [Fischerella sp. NIES-4106]|jgi:hypothetical protein|nr:hypothetical protein NIES4106_05830 [Fischerella sp. NIES-4106]
MKLQLSPIVNPIKHIINRELTCHRQSLQVIQLSQYFTCKNLIFKCKSIIQYCVAMQFLNLELSIFGFQQCFNSFMPNILYQSSGLF